MRVHNFRQFFSHLAQLEIWLVAFSVLASMALSKLLPLALLISIPFWGVRRIVHKRWSLPTPLDIGILLLVVMAGVTTLITALPEINLPQVYRLLSGIGLFYAMVNWAVTPRRLRWMVTTALLAGLVLVLISPISVQWTSVKFPFIPEEIYNRFNILVSDFVNPNVMAGSLVILAPLGLALLIFAWKKLGWGERLLAILTTTAITSALVLTQARGALFALAIVGVVLSLLRFRYGWILLFPFAGVMGGIVYWLGIHRVLNWLSTTVSLQGLEGRLEIWNRAVYMLKDFPFTGIGMGSFRRVVDVLYPTTLHSPGSLQHAHNLLLQIGVDLGIPGLVAWLTIWMLTTVCGWQVYQKGLQRQDRYRQGLGAGLIASQVALVTHGMLDAVTWGMVRSAPIVWAIWGLVIAARIVDDQAGN